MAFQGSIGAIRQAHLILRPDASRVLLRPFRLDSLREIKLVARILSLSEQDVQIRVGSILSDFDGRETEVRAFFHEQFEAVRSRLLTDEPLSEERQLLIG